MVCRSAQKVVRKKKMIINSFVYRNDIRIACMSLTKPIFPFIRFPRPIAANAIVAPTKELSILARRLISLAEIPGFFGDVMCVTIRDLEALVMYTESVKCEGPPLIKYDEKLDEYFSNEILYVEYSLIADRYTATGEPKSDSTTEGCVRLALLIFHNTAIWQFYPIMAGILRKPITTLQVAVEATTAAGCYSLCRDLLIWILFVGACACGHSLPREREFFVSRLASTIPSQRIQSWQDLRTLLMEFFYVDRCYLVLLREVWDEIRTVPVMVG